VAQFLRHFMQNARQPRLGIMLGFGRAAHPRIKEVAHLIVIGQPFQRHHGTAGSARRLYLYAS